MGPDDDDEAIGPPPPPEDRLWRHPSEMRGFAAPRPALSGFDLTLAQRRPWGVAAMSAVAGAILVGALWFTFGAIDIRTIHITDRIAVPTLDTTPPRLVDADDWAAELGREVWPSVVAIAVPDGSQASGLVLRDDGLVVTSASAVAGAPTISVTLADGRQPDVELLGVDPVTDVAVFRLVDTDHLQPALVGEVTSIAGQAASPSRALIGALDGDALAETGIAEGSAPLVRVPGGHVHDLQRIDAAEAVPGAAVLDTNGAVVAMVSGVASSDVLAVPIDRVRDVAYAIATDGTVDHDAWAGVGARSLDRDVAAAYGLTGAIEIESVVSGGPAAAGLRPGDVIVDIDGRSVGGTGGLVTILGRLEPGVPLAVTYLRDAEFRQATLVTGARPAD